MPTRFRMPPESSAGNFSHGVGRQIHQPEALERLALRDVLHVAVLVLVREPSRMFSNTFIESNRAPFWNT